MTNEIRTIGSKKDKISLLLEHQMQTSNIWYMLDKVQMSIALYETEGLLGLESAYFPLIDTTDIKCGSLDDTKKFLAS